MKTPSPISIPPAMAQAVAEVARAVASAPHGGKGSVYAQACQQLGISLPTLHRYLGALSVRPARRQRADAGDCTLSAEEARIISGMLMESMRKNNKRLLSIGQAVEVLRANGAVVAARLDDDTGELVPLSDAAIARALRAYSLHPDQLTRAAPSVELQSLHPNHVWQIDASLCVLYYLRGAGTQQGLQVMPREVFYKNKPGNLARIESERVWSYEVTDHYSGAIFVHYVLGAESAANLADSFIACTQLRDGCPWHGVPRILMMDMGSANTSGAFKNLARRLDVQLIAHAPGNARATGQVEKARDIIETSFESALKLKPVGSLEELNAMGLKWANWYNGTKTHSRHGMTRYTAWMRITAEQLRTAPAPELMRELLTHAPEQRKVSVTLTVSFGGREFDVSAVPGVMVGEKLAISHNVWSPGDSATVVELVDGAEVLHAVPQVQRNDIGFRADANVIGEDYKRRADTALQTNAKAIERLAMDAETDTEAEADRKAKTVPFGGRIDPFKGQDAEAAALPAYLPKRSTPQPLATTLAPEPAPKPSAFEVARALQVQAPQELPLLSHFAAATALARDGMQMTPERHASLRAWYPEGVPEADLPALRHRLDVRAGLRVVAGGG